MRNIAFIGTGTGCADGIQRCGGCSSGNGTGAGCKTGVIVVSVIIECDRRVDVHVVRFLARGDETQEIRESRDGAIVGREWAAGRIYRLLKDTRVYSVNAGIDMLRIGDLLAEYDLAPSWDGRFQDVVHIAAGMVLGQVHAGVRPQSDSECLWRLPYDDAAVSRAVGVRPVPSSLPDEVREAEERAAWARRLWTAVGEGRPVAGDAGPARLTFTYFPEGATAEFGGARMRVTGVTYEVDPGVDVPVVVPGVNVSVPCLGDVDGDGVRSFHVDASIPGTTVTFGSETEKQ